MSVDPVEVTFPQPTLSQYFLPASQDGAAFWSTMKTSSIRKDAFDYKINIKLLQMGGNQEDDFTKKLRAPRQKTLGIILPMSWFHLSAFLSSMSSFVLAFPVRKIDANSN